MQETPPVEFEEAMQFFIFDSIEQIHETQDPARFFRWVKDNYHTYFDEFVDTSDEAELNAISHSAARPIWNAMPLKTNRYRPKPLAKPGRNDRCFCGSGKKYKQCCQAIEAQMQLISVEDVWPVLIEILSTEEFAEIIKLKVLPIIVLIGLAEEAYEDGDYEFTCHTLEMLLLDPNISINQEADAAVNLLCNAYDALNDDLSKHEVLAILCESDNKWLSSTAFQRNSTVLIDDGEPEAAWAAFQTAQRLTPNNPALDILELTLLLGEEKHAQAQQRAQTIKHKWKKQAMDSDMPDSFAFIQGVIEAPETVLANHYTEFNSDTLDKLQLWIQAVAGGSNALHYSVETCSAKALDVDPLRRKETCFLKPSRALKKLESRWFEVYQDDKPFLDETLLEHQDDWLDTSEWIEFLDNNPLAFNNVSILDDIVTYLLSYEEIDSDRVFEHILRPIYQQAENILTLIGDQKRYDWGFIENRPLLRLLHNHIYTVLQQGDIELATPMMERQLRLNPNDNQGVRSLLMNAYLALGEDKKALDLAHIFEQDMFPEITLGRVLALYRLGKTKQAASAWLSAQKLLEHARRYLTASSLNPPAFNSYGVVMGSKEQMWLYREDMRKIWLSEKDIIKWLKQN